MRMNGLQPALAPSDNTVTMSIPEIKAPLPIVIDVKTDAQVKAVQPYISGIAALFVILGFFVKERKANRRR